jgi:hypothetical protein
MIVGAQAAGAVRDHDGHGGAWLGPPTSLGSFPSLDKSRPISHVVNVPGLTQTIPHAGFAPLHAHGRAAGACHG